MMGQWRRAMCSAVVAVLVAMAGPASAQTAAEADKLNAEVIRLYQAGKYSEAMAMAGVAGAIRTELIAQGYELSRATLDLKFIICNEGVKNECTKLLVEHDHFIGAGSLIVFNNFETRAVFNDDNISANTISELINELFPGKKNERSIVKRGFQGAKLDGASFKGANMVACFMEFASLRDVSLVNAVLAGCDFAGADMTNADVSGADFMSADMNSAHIGKLVNLDAAKNFEHVKNLEQAYRD